MLGLLRRVFSATVCMVAKKNLYTSLVRSQMSYCSMIWRPNLIKDIKCLETVQRRATKFILSDYSSDYRVRLLSLNLLPLMMQLELYDLVFLSSLLSIPLIHLTSLTSFPSALVLPDLLLTRGSCSHRPESGPLFRDISSFLTLT